MTAQVAKAAFGCTTAISASAFAKMPPTFSCKYWAAPASIPRKRIAKTCINMPKQWLAEVLAQCNPGADVLSTDGYNDDSDSSRATVEAPNPKSKKKTTGKNGDATAEVTRSRWHKCPFQSPLAECRNGSCDSSVSSTLATLAKLGYTLHRRSLLGPCLVTGLRDQR